MEEEKICYDESFCEGRDCDECAFNQEHEFPINTTDKTTNSWQVMEQVDIKKNLIGSSQCGDLYGGEWSDTTIKSITVAQLPSEGVQVVNPRLSGAAFRPIIYGANPYLANESDVHFTGSLMLFIKSKE